MKNPFKINRSFHLQEVSTLLLNKYPEALVDIKYKGLFVKRELLKLMYDGKILEVEKKGLQLKLSVKDMESGSSMHWIWVVLLLILAKVGGKVFGYLLGHLLGPIGLMLLLGLFVAHHFASQGGMSGEEERIAKYLKNGLEAKQDVVKKTAVSPAWA